MGAAWPIPSSLVGKQPEVDVPLWPSGSWGQALPAGGSTCDLHAWLGSGHYDHAQSDALMQVPLLHGGRHADDTHQQQRGVLEVLRRHLREASAVTRCPPGAQPQRGARASLPPTIPAP